MLYSFRIAKFKLFNFIEINALFFVLYAIYEVVSTRFQLPNSKINLSYSIIPFLDVIINEFAGWTSISPRL
jgi:hypothetical protein